MDRGTWWAIVHRVIKSRKLLKRVSYVKNNMTISADIKNMKRELNEISGHEIYIKVKLLLNVVVLARILQRNRTNLR